MPDYPSQMPSFDDEPPAPYRYGASAKPAGSSQAPKPWLLGVAGAALLGALFSGVSTRDFIQHLDRQVHQIHCSFVPGMSASFGESGCRTVMMSPYSSVLRESFWGGIPISLLALAVFSYLVARALSFALSPRITRRETGYLLLATCLPAGMSVIYGLLSVSEIGALCKLCVGVYVSSALGLLFAFIAHRRAPPREGADALPAYAAWFSVGVAYVAAMTLLYVAFAPREDDPAKGCGTLVKKDDPASILIPLSKGGHPALAVLDPLCPACRAFDRRLEASGVSDKLALSAVLFPLDEECNWMVDESLHPGACTVSEAMLCDEERAPAILAWAFEHQHSLLEDAKQDPRKVRRRLEEAFPSVKGCVGSPRARNRVNKSLRFAVANALPVLTPQLFIGETRLCDEDTDLGLEYTVARMLEAQAKGGAR